MLPTSPPFQSYTDRDGQPLDNGYVYFGEPDDNPQTAPVTVYWDAAGTQPAAQPLRTMNGYILRAGTPANVFLDVQYSVQVLDRNRALVYYGRDSDDFDAVGTYGRTLAGPNGSAGVGFIQAGAGADARTMQAKAREKVTPEDFGAVGDGTTNDYAALVEAITSLGGRGTLTLKNIYKINSNLSVPSGVGLVFEAGSAIKANTSLITFTSANTPIQAPLAQIFIGFGSGNVIFNAGYANGVPVVGYPEWWGVNDGSNTDEIAINKAIRACSTVILSGQYNVSNEVLVPYGGVNGGNKHLYGISQQGRILAAADNINVIHWSDSNGSCENLLLSGNGRTGTTGLRITPEVEGSTTTVYNQNNNVFRSLSFTAGDEAIVLMAGQAIAGTAAGCWYNRFYDINITSSKRGIWFKDGTAGIAASSGSNSNSFFGVNIRGSMNTGVDIKAGGGNIFFFLGMEQINTGTSPSATPTGLIIADTMSNGGANPNNTFYSPHWEVCTRHSDIDNDKTCMFNSDMDFSLSTGSATFRIYVPTNNTDFAQYIMGGIRSQVDAEAMRIATGGLVWVNRTNDDGTAAQLQVAGSASLNNSTNANNLLLSLRNQSTGNAAGGRIEFGNNLGTDTTTITQYGSNHATKANVFETDVPSVFRVLVNGVERAGVSSSGLQAINGFGCNGQSPQAAYSVGAASTDLASVIALANSLRAALNANGITF